MTVLPAVDEAFGLVLLESLASGTPVVAARSGACPEVVDSVAIGRLFEPDDRADLTRALVQALELSKDEHAQASCRRRAADYEWTRVVERYENVYVEALAAEGPQRRRILDTPTRGDLVTPPESSSAPRPPPEPGAEPPVASVVIPAFNCASTLGKTLEALGAQDLGEPFEVIVVDDGSDDATVAVGEASALDVRILRQHQQGPGPARNLGAEAAVGTALAFTDADCMPTASWLREGLEALAGAELVQGAVRPDPGSRLGPLRPHRLGGRGGGAIRDGEPVYRPRALSEAERL